MAVSCWVGSDGASATAVQVAQDPRVLDHRWGKALFWFLSKFRALPNVSGPQWAPRQESWYPAPQVDSVHQTCYQIPKAHWVLSWFVWGINKKGSWTATEDLVSDRSLHHGKIELSLKCNQSQGHQKLYLEQHMSIATLWSQVSSSCNYANISDPNHSFLTSTLTSYSST